MIPRRDITTITHNGVDYLTQGHVDEISMTAQVTEITYEGLDMEPVFNSLGYKLSDFDELFMMQLEEDAQDARLAA